MISICKSLYPKIDAGAPKAYCHRTSKMAAGNQCNAKASNRVSSGCLLRNWKDPTVVRMYYIHAWKAVCMCGTYKLLCLQYRATASWAYCHKTRIAASDNLSIATP